MLLLLSYPNETLKCIGGQIYDGVCAQMFLGEIKDSQAIYVELDVPVFGTANVCLNIWKNALFLLFWFTVWYTEYHCCSVGYWIHHWIFLRNGLLANLMDPLSLVNPHIKTWRIIFSAFSLIFLRYWYFKGRSVEKANLNFNLKFKLETLLLYLIVTAYFRCDFSRIENKYK